MDRRRGEKPAVIWSRSAPENATGEGATISPTAQKRRADSILPAPFNGGLK